ncbi:cytochrome P450 [Nocardia jinanensis]|uniref:Cytochrome P450 n=1 Tax=Nocardia jinanensis TaxID=382504 RepID=A0A917VNG4_9NOCA|nr:cytochrome P450 [Nocardia jinanensis]GGK98836.1 cytochrome P450 [Nocardia jinanensis]
MNPADSAPATARRFHRLDISAPAFWARDFRSRDEVFARLRAEPGLTWHAPAPALFPHEEPGFWAVTRHRDIAYISRHPELFTSSLGISMDPMPVELQRPTSFFLTMDPPQHTRYRRLVSSAFTPKQVRRIESQIRANAAEIVDEFLADLGAGPVDLVDSLSRKLPMRTVSDMIGIESADREAVAYAAEAMFSSSDEEYASLEERASFFMTQFGILHGAGTELAARRRREPRDDLMSAIVAAEVDGHRLSDEEIGAFMVLLASAGNDTTKQTTSHGFKALVDHPAQREWLLEDFDGRIGGAVEEFVRWATPVLHFARHAVTDTEVAGTPVRAGEKLVLFYCAANRDETALDAPHIFDLTRAPNPHSGFGGGGAHFCLGAWLARMQLRLLFHELLTRMPDVVLGEPEYVHSDFVHGIKRMPVRSA